jgi:hypothetical protein
MNKGIYTKKGYCYTIYKGEWYFYKEIVCRFNTLKDETDAMALENRKIIQLYQGLDCGYKILWE